MALILGYLLIGEIPALGLYFWAAVYCWRFIGKVQPRWSDLLYAAGIQLLWPIAVPVLLPYIIHRWRRAVQNEVCVCGHRRNQHDEGASTLCLSPPQVSARWLVNGEGDKHIYCECPKFTLPNVRPRR